MFDILILCGLVIAIIGATSSGLILKYRLHFDVSLSNLSIPIGFGLLGLAVCTQLRDFREASIYFLAAIIQFASFSFVSRLRQRSSFFWIVMASLASNSTWYITMDILKKSKAYEKLFIINIIGVIAGRTVAVLWAQYIEKNKELKANAALDPRLAPGKRIEFLAKEPTFWMLSGILLGYILCGVTSLPNETYTPILVVIGLCLLQSFLYSINARATQRGNNWYITLTGIPTSLTFYVLVIYVLSKDMPMALFIPYTVATSLGGAMGAFASMIVEWIWKLNPDAHLKETKLKVRNPWSARIPYIIVLIIAAIYIPFQEQIYAFFGHSAAPLTFPIKAITNDIPRALILLTSCAIFFIDSVIHTINSRAGNKNHSIYHTITCIPKGMITFAQSAYLALNTSVLDILPAGLIASCLGSLYGKDFSEKIERCLKATMDVHEEDEKAKTAKV